MNDPEITFSFSNSPSGQPAVPIMASGESERQTLTIWSKKGWLKMNKIKMIAELKTHKFLDVQVSDVMQSEATFDIVEYLENVDIWIWKYWWMKLRGKA